MPRPWQGKNRHRLKREFPFQSRQRRVTRASVDIQSVPPNGSLTLTGFAPTVSTPVVVTPGKASLVLTGIAPTVATPRLVTPAKTALVLTTFAPTVATPRVVTPAKTALTLTGLAPAVIIPTPVTVTPATARFLLIGQTPEVQGDVITGALGHVVSDSLDRKARFAEPDEPDEPPVLPFDNRPAIAALYAAGALNEDEFAALLAA